MYPDPNKLRVSQIVKACCMDKVEFISFMLKPDEPTEAMIRGTVLHSLVLENRLPENIAPVPFADFRKKEAQAAKAEAISKGLLPVKAADIEAWQQVIDPALRQEFEGYEIERPLSGYLEGFGHIQGKLDAGLRHTHVKDLKTTGPFFFRKLNHNIYSMGYDLQLYLYMKLCRAVTGEILLMDCATGCWQSVHFGIDEMEHDCQTRLVRGINNFQGWQLYQQGIKQLPQKDYQPPRWAFDELLDIENMTEEMTYEPNYDTAAACQAR